MPIDNVVDFILFVIPGYVASEIYYRHLPVKERSALSQLAQSVIGGIVVLFSINWLDANLLGSSLHSSFQDFPDPRYSLSLLAGGVILGYLAVGQFALRSTLASRVAWLSWLSTGPDSIWQQVNAPNIQDWAVVYLTDRSIYLGWISNYRFDPDASEQDFLLSQATRVDDKLRVLYPIDGLGIYINTRAVTRIEFVKGGVPNPRKAKRTPKRKRAA